MKKTLSQLLQEADQIIEKRASATPEASVVVAPETIEEDEIFKLAEQVRNYVPVIEKPSEVFQPTEIEKLAYSMAMLETILSSRELNAMMTFEKAAAERGMPQESVQKFFEKVAEKSEAGRRVFDFMIGAGKGLEGYIDSLPRNLSGAEGVGKVVGAATPLVAAGAGGAFLGSAAKENEIKSKYGIS